MQYELSFPFLENTIAECMQRSSDTNYSIKCNNINIGNTSPHSQGNEKALIDYPTDDWDIKRCKKLNYRQKFLN